MDDRSKFCRLSREEKKLVKSHIIPEWAYKPMYDPNHKYAVVDSENIKVKMFKQIGEFEKLLCQECDNEIGVFDRYARTIIFCKPSENTIGIITRAEGHNIIIENVDYKMLKLFQISILWRSSISNRPFFREVSLGPHEEILRKMLIRSDPGKPTEYGCLMAIQLNEKGEMSQIMTQPERVRLGGQIGYIFRFAGCWWCFVVSSHSKWYRRSDQFLKPNSDLVIPKVRITDREFIANFLGRNRPYNSPSSHN